MVQEAISIPADDRKLLAGAGEVLRGGQASLLNTKGEKVALPDSVHQLILTIVTSLEEGHGLVLLPEEQEMSIEGAADLLAVPPYYLEHLLAEEVFGPTSARRKTIPLQQVVTVGRRLALQRRTALDQMTREEVASGQYDDALEGGADDFRPS